MPETKNILLVEDDAAIVDIYTIALKKAGFAVDTAGSGQEALKKVGAGSFDLLILDLVLPDMNGMDVLKEMKKNEALKNMPVFIMTNQELSAEPSEVKPDQYIIKAHITPTQLVELIKKQLHA